MAKMFLKEPEISVGILTAPTLRFSLHGNFIDSLTGQELTGEVEIAPHAYFGKRFFIPVAPENFFELKEVVIGKKFHWERKENQSFRGTLKLLPEGDELTAVNVIGIEEYLRSVISSEMSALSPAESLRAHAVISRSWLLSQIVSKETCEKPPLPADADNEYIRWFDREEHDRYDVCADDHCQRYQGITRAHTPEVDAAITATRGEVMIAGERICDARYSKCCGGMTEAFEYVWEPVSHPCLTRVQDSASPQAVPDLRIEHNARRWIESSPKAFCNTSDKALLQTVLNRYDQETADFYRWQVEYTQTELSALLQERLGMNFGAVEALIPVERGVSGRLVKLKIVGSRRTMTIGKELLIRQALSPSHLYSSAFVVDTREEQGEKRFLLKGAGWGHGVGLCQIGAAVMGSRGYRYSEILAHYYPGAKLQKLY